MCGRAGGTFRAGGLLPGTKEVTDGGLDIACRDGRAEHAHSQMPDRVFRRDLSWLPLNQGASTAPLAKRRGQGGYACPRCVQIQGSAGAMHRNTRDRRPGSRADCCPDIYNARNDLDTRGAQRYEHSTSVTGRACSARHRMQGTPQFAGWLRCIARLLPSFFNTSI